MDLLGYILVVVVVVVVEEEEEETRYRLDPRNRDGGDSSRLASCFCDDIIPLYG